VITGRTLNPMSPWLTGGAKQLHEGVAAIQV
jgi:hypothetical protein